MASQTYTFTHVSNSVFTTQVTITDAAVGQVNWVAYFVRSSTSWTSYNINNAGNANAPRMDIALGGATLGGGLVYYTYDFRTGGTANMSKLIGSGTINVTPGAAISFSGTNDPKGSMGIANASGTFTTQPWPTPAWGTGETLPTATRGSAYSTAVSASPVTSYGLVTSSGATGGLSLGTNGVISGTPTETGTASFTVRAFNNSSSADRTFTFTVNPPAPVFTDATVNPTANVGSAYSDAVSASNATSYSVFSGNLPTGLSLNPSTGAITGTPTVSGPFSFVIRATNVTGNVNTSQLTITAYNTAGVWNGSQFVPGRMRVWDGLEFKDTFDVRVWNGSTFVQSK